MEKYLERSLSEEEVVHHLDCNPANNRIDNLLLLTKNMHAKLHLWIDAGAFISESYDRNGMNSGKSKVTEPPYCKVCGKTVWVTMTILSQALHELVRKVQRLGGV